MAVLLLLCDDGDGLLCTTTFQRKLSFLTLCRWSRESNRIESNLTIRRLIESINWQKREVLEDDAGGASFWVIGSLMRGGEVSVMAMEWHTGCPPPLDN